MIRIRMQNLIYIVQKTGGKPFSLGNWYSCLINMKIVHYPELQKLDKIHIAIYLYLLLAGKKKTTPKKIYEKKRRRWERE